jgi:hypothetical protein
MHTLFLPQPHRPAGGPTSLAPQTSHTHRPRLTPTPVGDWPLWTRAIAKFRHIEDTGIGDTLVHLIGDARSERFKKWFARKFGKTCGCTERQRWMNQKFPYLR